MWRQVVKDLIVLVEENTCTHTNTHRGGVIWEICDDCGAKWADDMGGKPEYERPEALVRAEELLLNEGFKLNSQKTVAVSTETKWLPTGPDTPRSVKLQLLGEGGVACYGIYCGEPFWVKWAPVPRH